MAEQVSEEATQKPKWSKRRVLLVAFAALIICATAITMPGLFWELHEADKTLHDFGGALVAKQYEQAYAFASPELRAATDYSTFVKVHDGLTLRMGDLKNIEIDNSEIKERADGWHATVDAQMVFARGSLSFVFVLKKANGSWRIYSYHEQ